jgi:hypothetical protein
MNKSTTSSACRWFAALLLIVLCFAAASVSAQTTAFTYQGRLTEGAMSANSTYDFEFALFDAQTGGTQIGSTQTSGGVIVSNGSFTTQLDFGATAFPGANRFLEIRVKSPSDAAYTTLAPRQAITSTPYAIRALNATNAVNATNATTATSAGSATTATNVSGVVAVANGGTGSSTKNFVDLQFNQTIFGNKTFTGAQTFNGNLTQYGNFTYMNLTNGFVVTGTYGTGAIPATGAGTRMMFYPSKSAFRAGYISGNQWDGANVGDFSTATGLNTTASSQYSTAMGYTTKASGIGSTAMGTNASTNGQTGSFVYGDYTNTATLSSTAGNEFAVRASGGFRFITSADLSKGCTLGANSGQFGCTSTKTLKNNFQTISGTDVLSKIRKIPVMKWSYRGEQSGVRHIGAFAEDFYREFKLGTDNKSIGLLDMAGVNLAATKELDRQVQKLKA